MEGNKEVICCDLWDTTDKLVAHFGDTRTLSRIFQEKINENFIDNRFRNIYRKNENGSVRLVVTVDNPYFQGTKGVTRSCEVYLSLIPHFKKIENSRRQHFDSIIRRFAHNLVKFQTRFKGNFNRLISDNARSRPFIEFKDEVKRRIEANTDIAAQDICQISHRAVDLDAQIDTLRVISGYAEKTPSSIIKVDLQKTIFRLTNPFIDEFKKKSIEININIPILKNGISKVLVEPSLFNASIWQLLDNASKYALNGEPIEIKGVLDVINPYLEISMISVCIDQDEIDRIFLEGYKGRNAGSKSENGIGLYIVKKALSLMDAKISVINEGFVRDFNQYKYCKHKFIIEFQGIQIM